MLKSMFSLRAAIVEGKKPTVWAENASEVNIRVENAVYTKNQMPMWIGSENSKIN